ncbi:MAG: tryptophan-rich sensory protein [Candidatus Diapherotrites archaeon]|uniref:Tryptophan-rich sensory protein n=1 Tax=Candidatus Iainarchaeum sp. TaxID=3101447 RepID=A0A938YVS4_9ARCH|nr:tryptophan-rich sensory protein [Candidatus Diapherotrites archaeon]
MKAGSIAKLAISILLCQAAGILGSVFTFQAIPNWYAALEKPWFTPPNWAFGPVWIALYTLMGIALFLVWQKGLETKKAKLAIGIFGVQLALNAIWSIIFFGMQMPFPAFIEILLLWIAIAATIVKFWPISRKAALLLIPYIVWVSIATALNYSVWVLNA